MNHYSKKQIAALRLGIEALTDKRRPFCPGHLAYTQQGIRPDVIDSEGVTGVSFQWAESDHLKYEEYSKAIQQLEDLIEILTDPGVVRVEEEQLSLLEQSNG